MIPYLASKTIELGPMTLYVWGIFVACGFLLGTFVAGRFAKRYELKSKIMYDLSFWMILFGLIGGRLGYTLFYGFADFFQNPISIFQFWDGGYSFYGGFIACVIFAVWYLKKQDVSVWEYADVAVFGLPFGLWVGRFGCFLIHDHPGTVTRFFLGVQYPDGWVRHDLGLYESIFGFCLAVFFLYSAKKTRPIGFYLVWFCLSYGAVRFFLDFYRLFDVKYLGFTFAQYFSMILFGLGVAIHFHLQKIHNS